MRYLRKESGEGSRPYPLDRERRKRVLVVLAEKEMTISDLAKKINLARSCVSEIINGRRISLKHKVSKNGQRIYLEHEYSKTEKRIADFLGKPVEKLFPFRSPEELKKMRLAEKAQSAKERAS